MHTTRIERTLQVLVAVMAVLGTYLLSTGQELAVLPPLMVFVALSSLYLTDIKRRFEMGPTMSSIVAVAAAAVAAWQMFSGSEPGPFIAMANLLSYLEVVLLYQRKNPRVYWQLLMLSLLQIVVSTALNEGLPFGMTMIAFMFLFILAMLLLLTLSESQRCSAGGESAISWPELSAAQSSRRHEVAIALFTGQHTPGLLWNAFGCRLIGRAATATVVSLLIASVVFFLVPRKGRSARLANSLMGLERLIGFSESVELGQPGQLRSSGENVMRVRFTDDRTNEPYQVIGEPLFRGVVLSRYLDRQWLPTHSEGEIPRIIDANEIVRQEISLEPLASDAIPAVYPAFPLEWEPALQFDDVGRRWRRSERMVSKQMTLTLGTTGFRNGKLRDVTPCFSNVDREALTQLPRHHLPKLVETAQRVVQEAGLEDGDRRGQARALERYFLDPASGYRYSLTSPARDASLDPNEHFVAENQVGHCEYFASSLVMMLRSQGIPARMIAGFRGGLYNAAGDYWTVTQDDAHAWVEVYLEPSQIMPYEMGNQARARGGWLRLDPTPGGTSDEGFAVEQSLWSHARSAIDYMQLLWSVYVDRLDVDVQQKRIYQPIVDQAQRLADALAASGVRGQLRRFAKALGLGNGRWFSWRAAGASMLFVLVLVGLSYTVRGAWRKVARRRRVSDQAATGNLPPVAAFYRRLEEILARYGHARRPGQTQREMAATASEELAKVNAYRAVAELPCQVVDAYYQVRFGERSLTHEKIRQLEQSLDRLEAGLVVSTS